MHDIPGNARGRMFELVSFLDLPVRNMTAIFFRPLEGPEPVVQM